jgi:hypothetical protein
VTYLATAFAFELQSGESIRDRVVRCCLEALTDGPLGHTQRAEVYRDFIACNQEQSKDKASALATVKTSCALFVRAIRHWCGAAPAGAYVIGSGMFKSLGNVSFGHPAWVNATGASPQPGDYFYIAASKTSHDGHTGIFIEELETNVWKTAEGGGGDGTQCSLNQRRIANGKFSNDGRTLWGWFDCEKVGLPASPDPSDVPNA